MILQHPDWVWRIVALCRGSDPDRSPKFFRVMERLGAKAAIADLDDGPDQDPLAHDLIQETIRDLVGRGPYDLVLTHGPQGEYTYHRRHVETSAAVSHLWGTGDLITPALWMFAYQDRNRQILPEPAGDADRLTRLPRPIWEAKYRLITELYGFAPESWEARATPRQEAFYCKEVDGYL